MADPIVPSANAPPPTAPASQGYFGAIPQMSDGMTFREIGNSGLRAFSGWVREEFLAQLQGRNGATVYREMADNSPIIGGILYAITSTIRKVAWRTDPADDTPAAAEMADFADSLRTDMSHTWEDSIVENLSMLTYGYAPHEIVYKRRLGAEPGMDPDNPGKELPSSQYDDGRIGWRKLPLRGQDTIIKWFFENNGEIAGLTQQPWTGPMIDLPIEKLLLFRPSQHKGNPEGRSILRTAYRPYYLIKRLEELEAIVFERMGGLPLVKVPMALMEQADVGNADAQAAINTFKKIAVNLRIDEQMGLLMPSDPYSGVNGPSNLPQYSLELIAPGGGKGGGTAPTADQIIVRHQTNMMISVMADFLALGHNRIGAQSLATAKEDMFFQAIEGYLDSIGSVYSRHGLRRIWKLNGLNPDLMPAYKAEMAARLDLDVLGKFIFSLSQSGMALFPNQDLESALLDSAGLPDIQDTGAADLLTTLDQPPVSVVGPLAAQATQELAPPPEPVNTAFGKMILGSLARRMLKTAGPSMPINTSRKIKRRT